MTQTDHSDEHGTVSRKTYYDGLGRKIQKTDEVGNIDGLHLRFPQIADLSEVSLRETVSSFTPQTEYQLIIGARTGFGGVYFPGMFDELRMYGSPLSKSDITQIHNAKALVLAIKVPSIPD